MRNYIYAVRADWKTPGSPVDLAAARIIVFGLAAWFTAFGYDWPWFSGLPAVLRKIPDGSAWLGDLPLSSSTVEWLRSALVAGAVAAALGVWTRVMAIITCLLGAVVWGMPQLVGGKVDHYHHILWFAVVLASSRCGDALSIDAWRRAAGVPANAIAYSRPLRFLWLILGLLYLFPGLAKAAVGPLWLAPENLRRHLYQIWWQLDFIPAIRIDATPPALFLGAAHTVVFELSFIVLVLHPRTRLLAAAWALAFHNLTRLLMGIPFWQLQICYLTFVPWSRLRVFKRHPRAGTAAGSSRSVNVVGAIVVASALIAAVGGFDGWPWGVYPRFNYLPGMYATRLVLEVRDSAGGVDIRQAELAAQDRMKPARWKFVLARAAEERDPATRNAMARAIIDILAEEDRTLLKATTISIFRDTVSVDPLRSTNPLVERTELATLQVR